MVWYVLVHLKSNKNFYGKEIRLPLEQLIEELQNPNFKYSLLVPNFEWENSGDIRIYTGIWDIDFTDDNRKYSDIDLNDCIENLPNSKDYIAWFSGGKGIRVLHYSGKERMRDRLYCVDEFDSTENFESDEYSSVIYPPLQAYLDNIIHPGRGIKFDFQKHPKTNIYPYLQDRKTGGYIGEYYTKMLQNLLEILNDEEPRTSTSSTSKRKRGGVGGRVFEKKQKTVDSRTMLIKTFEMATDRNLASFYQKDSDGIITNWHPSNIYHSKNKVLLKIKEIQKEKIFYTVHCLSSKCSKISDTQIHIIDRCDAFPGGALERLCDTRLSKQSKEALITKFKSVTHIHEKFLPKDLLVKKSSNLKEVFLVSSTMGTGKTEMIMEYTKKFKKILWISPRRIFAEALAKATGFFSYMDSKFDLYDHDKVIVSLESITRILRKDNIDLYKMQEYDLIVCDEWNAFMNVVCNDTLKDRYLHLKIFINLVTNPKTSVVLTDAFFGEEEFFAIRRMPGMNLSDIHFIYNTNFECDTNSYIVYLSYFDWVEQLKQSVNILKNNVAIVSTSRNKLVNLMDMLKGEEQEGLPEEEFVILTGDTEKAKKKLISIDDWSKFRVFGYTPTMTVGNSFSQLHFHDIFLVVTGNMDYKTVIQMTRRIRRTINQRVLVYIKYPMVKIQSLFDDKNKILQSLGYIDTTRGDLGTKEDYTSIEKFENLFKDSPFVKKCVQDISRDAMMNPNKRVGEVDTESLVYVDILNYYFAPTATIDVPLEIEEDGDMENRHKRIDPLVKYILSLFFISDMERKIVQSESRKLLYFNSLIHSACGKNIIIQLPISSTVEEKSCIQEHKVRDSCIGISFLRSLDGIMTKPILMSSGLVHSLEVENELVRKAKNLGFINLSPMTTEIVETLSKIFSGLPSRYYEGNGECYNGFIKLTEGGKDIGQNYLSKYLTPDAEEEIFDFIHIHWPNITTPFPESWHDIVKIDCPPPKRLLEFIVNVRKLKEKQRKFVCPPIGIFKFIMIEKPTSTDQKKKNIMNALRYACHSLGLPLRRKSSSDKKISFCCIDRQVYMLLSQIALKRVGFQIQGPNPALPCNT